MCISMMSGGAFWRAIYHGMALPFFTSIWTWKLRFHGLFQNNLQLFKLMIQDLNYGTTATAVSRPILSHNFPQLIQSSEREREVVVKAVLHHHRHHHHLPNRRTEHRGFWNLSKYENFYCYFATMHFNFNFHTCLTHWGRISIFVLKFSILAL